MSYADFIYGTMVDRILRDGIKEHNNRTDTDTYRGFGLHADFFPDEFGLPILESKKLYWKTAADELFWIFIKCSTNINDMKHPKIWAKWADENGSIGKSYGYQAGKPAGGYDTQLKYIVGTLTKDPSSRQANMSLWGPEDLAEMNLPPCVLNYHFLIAGGKLNLYVYQRSADFGVGVPFDILEAGILQKLVLHELKRNGIEVGLGQLTFGFGDAHVYDSHVAGLKEQLAYINNMTGRMEKPYADLVLPDKSIFDMVPEDLQVINYDDGPVRTFELIK